MANRQKYTVLVPFPHTGGHWTDEGAELDLLDVQAHALVTAGRLKLTAEIEAEAAAAAATEAPKATKKTPAKAE
jgi:hypothetical protein